MDSVLGTRRVSKALGRIPVVRDRWYSLEFVIRNGAHSFQDSINRLGGPPEDIAALDPSHVERMCEKAAEWFEPNEDGSISPSSRVWEVWDTAHAVLGLSCVSGNGIVLRRAIDYLLAAQRADGGFFTKARSADPSMHCAETTAVVMNAVVKSRGKVIPELERAVEFLLRTQLPNGCWELPYIPPEFRAFPSVTAYALLGLQSCNATPAKAMERAISYLAKTQRENGSWGWSIHSYSSEGYTVEAMSRVLATALETAEGKLRVTVRRLLSGCLGFAVRKQLNDGSWLSRWPVRGRRALTTALFLKAILVENNGGAPNLAARYLTDIIRSASHWGGGSMYGLYYSDKDRWGTVDDSIDTFVNAKALQALREYTDSLKNKPPG